MSLALAHQSRSAVAAHVAETDSFRGTRRAPFRNAPVLQRKASCACGGSCPRCAGELPVQTKISASPRMLQRQVQDDSPQQTPGPAQPSGQTPQPAQQQAAPPPPASGAALIKDKKFDTNENIEALAGILYHETRGGLGTAMNVAIGWIVLNRMLILNRTRVATLIGGNQLASLPGAPFNLKLLAYMLLSGHYEDPTNGSFFYVTPKIMPDFPNRACCSDQPGDCNTLRFENGVDCKGGLQTVPGTQEQRFFPSFAQAGKRQPQPEGTDPMLIQVFQR